MTRHLKRWLNDAALEGRGGTYQGVIGSVTEEVVRNRFSAQRELQPVIGFTDGWRLIPNLGMRRALIEILGAESDNWIGRTLTVTRRQVDRIDKSTGLVRGRQWVKGAVVFDPHARTPVERADYDDGPEALAEAAPTTGPVGVDESFRGRRVAR